MKFFGGDLTEAIAKLKKSEDVLLVFVQGEGSISDQYEEILSDEFYHPPKNCVAIRISTSSDSYKHFETIYRNVPVPSIFFIDSSGVPVAVVSADIIKEELQTIITDVLLMCTSRNVKNRKFPSTEESDSVHIQFKLPNGETAVVEFPEMSSLKEVRMFITQSLNIDYPFKLTTPFPRRDFSQEDEFRTLLELSLSPTSTILVIPLDDRSFSSWGVKLISQLVYSLVRIIRRMLNRIKELFSRALPRR